MSAPPLEPHTEAEEATLARFEGAEPAEESFANVERVMQAIWEAADGYMSGVPWERAKANPFREAKVFRQAVAAIEAMKGPSHAAIVREAIDLCWKATPYTEDEDGFIAAYLLPAGVVHRLLGQLQGAGYPAAFRAAAAPSPATTNEGNER